MDIFIPLFAVGYNSETDTESDTRGGHVRLFFSAEKVGMKDRGQVQTQVFHFSSSDEGFLLLLPLLPLVCPTPGSTSISIISFSTGPLLAGSRG